MQNVYLVQMESIPGEKARNLAHAVSLVESASVKSGGIILFPEMFATGYLPKDPASEAENFEDGNGETASVLSDLANKTGCTIFGAGIAKKGNAITNLASSPNSPGTTKSTRFSTSRNRSVRETRLLYLKSTDGGLPPPSATTSASPKPTAKRYARAQTSSRYKLHGPRAGRRTSRRSSGPAPSRTSATWLR